MRFVDFWLYLWHNSAVPVFLEKFVLPLFATLVVLLALTNPMRFDNTQRITGTVAIVFAAFFFAHTVYKSAAKVPPPPHPQPPEAPAPLTEAEQKEPEADKKKKPKAHKPVVQQGQGNVNIDQHTEGNNSPITNSPITVNPPVNPNALVITYDFNGVKHIVRPGQPSGAEAGELFGKFQEMAALEKDGKWGALRDAAEAQIKAVPDWLTPYLSAAEAYANLGNKSKAIELCEYVKKHSGGNPDFDSRADNLLSKLRP